MRADNCAPCPENWPIWLSGTPSRSARRSSMNAAPGDRRTVDERHDDRGEQSRNSEHPANPAGGEQLALAGRLQLGFSNLQRGPVAVPLCLQLGLERVGFGLPVGLDATGFVLRGELGLEFGLGLDGAGLGSAGSAGFPSLEQAHPGCLPVISSTFRHRDCNGAAQHYRPGCRAPRVRPMRNGICSSSKPEARLCNNLWIVKCRRVMHEGLVTKWVRVCVSPYPPASWRLG